MSRARSKWLGAVVLIAALGGGAAYVATREGGDATQALPTVRVARGELVEVASVSGTIEPHAQVEVRSRVSGEVVEVAVVEGQQVEAGALLFRLDTVDAERQLRAAEADLRRLRASLTQARAEVGVAQASAREAAEVERINTRGVELGLTSSDTARARAHESAVAAAQVTLRTAQASSAQAQVQAAQLAVEEARRNLERTEIRAPFAGTVLSVGVERGSIVSSALTNVSGGTTLVTIADLSDLRIIGALDEAQVGQVAVGQDVIARVDAYPDRTFTGRVQRVSPLGRNDTNIVVFDVEIVITDPNASLLRSGMSADVEITTRRDSDLLLVPLTAIRSRGAVREVELANGEVRQIRTGATDGTQIAVLEGLSEGDEILAVGRPREAPSAAGRSILPTPGRRTGSGGGGGGGAGAGGPPR